MHELCAADANRVNPFASGARSVDTDVRGLDDFGPARPIRIAGLYVVSSGFAMEQIKYTTALPLDYMA